MAKEVKKARTPRRFGITENNYMEFSAKDLFAEIEKLRNVPSGADLKKQNTKLRRKLTNIAKIAVQKEE